MPVTSQTPPAQKPSFEGLSIKPTNSGGMLAVPPLMVGSRFLATNVTVKDDYQHLRTEGYWQPAELTDLPTVGPRSVNTAAFMESERARALTGGPKDARTTSEDTRNKRSGRKFQSTHSFVWIKREAERQQGGGGPAGEDSRALRSEGGHAVLTASPPLTCWVTWTSTNQ